MSDPGEQAVAVVVARDGRLPVGADEAVAEAGGTAVVIGSGSLTARRCPAGRHSGGMGRDRRGIPAGGTHRTAGSPPRPHFPGHPAGIARRTDLAPRLAAALDRPLVARAIEVRVLRRSGREGTDRIEATVTRLDDRVLLPVEVHGPAVVTLVSGTRRWCRPPAETVVEPLPPVAATGGRPT